MLLKAMPVAPPASGWVRVGGQLAHYGSIGGTTTTDGWQINLAAAGSPYGLLTVPIPAGEIVEWVDAIMSVEPHGLDWSDISSTTVTPGDPTIRAQPTDTPVVVLAVDQAGFETWPHLEGFVQDGRYQYAGAAARAHEDLNRFAMPVVSMEWDTTDPGALPGREVGVGLLGPEFPGGGISARITILSVEITFPLPTLPPHRHCTGGQVQQSTFLDLVVTETN